MAHTTTDRSLGRLEHCAADAAAHFLLMEDVAPESLSRLLRYARRAPELDRQVIAAFLVELVSMSLRASAEPESRPNCRTFCALTELGDDRAGVVKVELVSDGHGRWTVIRVLFEEEEAMGPDIHLLAIPAAHSYQS